MAEHFDQRRWSQSRVPQEGQVSRMVKQTPDEPDLPVVTRKKSPKLLTTVKWAIVHLPYIHIKGMMKDYSGFVTTVAHQTHNQGLKAILTLQLLLVSGFQPGYETFESLVPRRVFLDAILSHE